MSLSSFFTDSEAAEGPSDWPDILPQNPLFEALRDEGIDKSSKEGNITCEIRGDLFVWSSAKSALLTTNLKRLKAHLYEEQTFQTLVCTSAPLMPVIRLVPNEIGSHIALVSEQAVSVMTLARSRGEHGEFGGGQRTVTCRVTPIANDLFTIYQHSLRLLQTQWHPTLPLTLLLLTNDSILRVFSLADPNYPRYSLPLSPSAANQVHSCSLEDLVVSTAFTRHSNRLFALRDTGDVIETKLATPRGHAPSEPLPMHPISEDNYGTDDASALLVLETTPLILIIAHSSGTIYHCVYIDTEEEEEEEEEEERGERLLRPSGILYVVECVKLTHEQDDDDSEDTISLIKDPVIPYRYFILHSGGVHMATLPWANRMTQFTTSSVEELVMQVDSEIQPVVLIDTSTSTLLGVTVISESLLGASIVCLDSDLLCHALSLQPPPPSQYVADFGATPTRPHPLVKPESDGFEKVIRDLLTSDSPDPVSLPRPKSDTPTQQECFKYFHRGVQKMREKYLLPQQNAKSALQHRLQILRRQKEQQISELMALRDNCTELIEMNEGVREKLSNLRGNNIQLLNRLEKLLCRLDAQSPVLSDAEVRLEQELNQLTPKMQAMSNRIEEAKGKLTLGYGETPGEKGVKMSRAQDKTICIVLEDSGKRLMSLKVQIQGLFGAIPS